MHSPEKIEQTSDVDLCLGQIGDMSLEMFGIKDMCPKLSAKETFVATQLIESSFMKNENTKKMLIAFNTNNLLPNLDS